MISSNEEPVGFLLNDDIKEYTLWVKIFILFLVDCNYHYKKYLNFYVVKKYVVIVDVSKKQNSKK